MSPEHAARLVQVPRLTWVMARAYAPRSSHLLGLLVALWSLPAYLLVTVNGWGAKTLLASANGHATFTATPLTEQGRRREWGWSVLPLVAVYLVPLHFAGEKVADLADVHGFWPDFTVQMLTISAIMLLVLFPTRPWTVWRNRAARNANRSAQTVRQGPRWELEMFAAWPRERGFGMAFVKEVLQTTSKTGTAWLVARDLGLVPVYERVGCRVVEGSGGRGMTLELGRGSRRTRGGGAGPRRGPRRGQASRDATR